MQTMNKIEHDDLIDKIFAEFRKADKSKYTSLFISSLSSKNMNWRSGLSVFAIMQSFPNHNFTLGEHTGINDELFERMSIEDKQFVKERIPCKFCSEYKSIKPDFELAKEAFKKIGGLLGADLLCYYHFLSETNKIENVKPCNEDFRIFSEILTILTNAEPNETVKKTIFLRIKKIKGFKSNSEQLKALLETLGFCSILETEKQKGLLNEYINLAVAPRKTHGSDWNYPVDFWLGKDGINKEAFRFWFGEYKELEQFWK